MSELAKEQDFDDDCAEEPTEGCRARHWVFTKHNYDDDHEAVVYSMGPCEGAVYVSCGREICPKTGTPHYQGVVSWTTVKSWKQMRELLDDAYWKPKVARSTFKQWADYTKKDGDHYEYGVLPADPVDKGELGKRHWQEQLDLVEQKRYREMHPQVRAVHLAKLEYAVAATLESERPAAVTLPVSSTSPNEWHWGVSGCGKTRYVRSMSDYEHEIEDDDWADYKGGNVHFDEVTVDEARRHINKLKKWGHEYPFKIKRKYLPAMSVRPDRIFITSQDDPSTMFKGEHWAAIQRRYRIFHWPEPYFVPNTNKVLNDNWAPPPGVMMDRPGFEPINWGDDDVSDEDI